MSAPICKQCRKEMRPVYAAVCADCGVAVWSHALSRDGMGPRNGACDRLYSRVADEAVRVRQKKVLEGYGYRKNGKFCTLSCAYYWALEHVK